MPGYSRRYASRGERRESPGDVLRYVFSVALVVIVALAALRIQQRHEWFRLQAAQVAAFTSLQQFPPKGLDHQSWRSTINTPINVWVNATYHPGHSNISNAEMKSLRDQIQSIASVATCDNSIHSVDDVLSLLAERNHMKAFVVGFREEFRSHFPQHFQLVQ